MAGGAVRISNLVKIAIIAAVVLMPVAAIGDVAIAASTGSINGRVETDNVAPISGAHVAAYYWETGVLAGEAHTAEDGTYSIAGLALDTYSVRADAATYLPEYYREGKAIVVAVCPPDATNNIDFTLTPCSSISGSIYQADGTTPIDAARVVAYRKVGGTWEYAADRYADSRGNYSLAIGTVTGTYRVRAQAMGYAAEYYSSDSDPAEVIEIQVGAGEDIPGINFTLSEIGFISGTTYKADGATPISGVYIVAYDCATGGSVDEAFSGA